MTDATDIDNKITDIIRRAEVTLAGRDGPLRPDPQDDVRAILQGAREFRDLLHRYQTDPQAYTGSVIHDLRGRLNSVTGFAEMLIDDADAALNANQRGELEMIYRAGLELRDYINTTFRAEITGSSDSPASEDV